MGAFVKFRCVSGPFCKQKMYLELLQDYGPYLGVLSKDTIGCIVCWVAYLTNHVRHVVVRVICVTYGYGL